jgi:hypothetical protein
MEWINVKDRLPSKDTQVIGYVKGHHSFIMMLGYGIPTETTWYCWVDDIDISENYEVTHWQPLMEGPKIKLLEVDVNKVMKLNEGT